MCDGAIDFIKYAYPPNKLRYCGPSNDRAIFNYFSHKEVDQGLIELLSKFDGAYPNLLYIAQANGISNPFSKKVVEAYWIGNELLANVSISNYYQYLRDRYRGQWDNHALDMVFGESRGYGAKPHHGFHVLSLFAKKKKNRKIMDHVNNCLILPGTVIETKSDAIKVKYNPIVFKDKMIIGGEKIRNVRTTGLDKYFIGDKVSFHWDWICDKITDTQITNLMFWNKYHIGLVNNIL